MKRTIPLLITAVGGFVLIGSFFIPMTEGWGEVATIWFDILAAIAFLLGGGNLMKIHLKKISDRQAGWGYSGVTLVAFLAMLFIGLFKIGVPPATIQEHFGESFTPLVISDFPESQMTSIDGEIPNIGDGAKLPESVRNQLSESDGKLIFRGWMMPNQKYDLIQYQDVLKWQCTVETLFTKAQPEDTLKGKVHYYADHQALSFTGFMTEEHEQALLTMDDSPAWKEAVRQLAEQSRVVTEISLERLPDGIEIPESLQEDDIIQFESGQFRIQGPMSASQRDQLANQFPLARPLQDVRRDAFRQQIEELGEPFSEHQVMGFNKLLDGGWRVSQLHNVLDVAGKAQEVSKTACEMLAEKEAGIVEINSKIISGEDVSLTEAQVALLGLFATDNTLSPADLIADLKQAGPFTGTQESALRGFASKNPTVGERNQDLCFILLRAGSLTERQRDFLLNDYRNQVNWRRTVGSLFMKAHLTKYPWSGLFNEPGSAFEWMFEYLFKPLTATMFSMLAFYVASAAFRAFRAKNIEATLLLGTAFIILLGRTFAGVVLTSWMPEALSGLRIENLTLYIMSVFNTAGNRAIMIGIALGVASMSLKVLLGIDRTYLGSSEE